MSELTRLSDHSDRYLQHYHNTEVANERVMAVMGKWYAMVQILTDRAIEELELPPDNVYQMHPRGGAIPYQSPEAS